jgi:hypothetical protein
MTTLQSAAIAGTPVTIEITVTNGMYCVHTYAGIDGWNYAGINGWNGIPEAVAFFDNEDSARQYANEEFSLVITARNAADRPEGSRDVSEGFWRIGHRIFRVKMSQKNHLYAQELIGTTWTYAPGMMARLSQGGQPLTREAAETYGRTFGACALCGRTLTNPESIERGIGPVCASRAGW